MKLTIEDIIRTKENHEEIDIVLSNGKIMSIDFLNNSIMRFVEGKGCEQYREFNSDTNKMLNLCQRYLKNQK